MAHSITFSTLACPDWSREDVVANAAAFGYDGIEWRGGPQGHVQPELSPAARAALRRSMADAGLSALAVTAYTSLIDADPQARAANVDMLRRYADLAADLGARYVRAFLGRIPAGADLSVLYERAAECLEAAAQHAGTHSVTIVVEPHDEFVRSSVVAPLLDRVRHPAVGVIWDIGNTFAAGEDPPEGVQLLGERICYTHVKDGIGRGAAWRLTPIGLGQVPLRQAFALLLARGYTGALNVEWERAWHPELDPPEIALPAALRSIRQLLSHP
ncbi:MAG: sugar phosphate isomerase/epimerase family protein [Roseiflexaceae bacterium]